MEELGIEGACNQLWDCWDAYGAADGVELEAEGLLQQIQLYNVALKQEDGEPVTEDEIRQVEWDHGCQMAIAGFLDRMYVWPFGLLDYMAPLRCAAKFDPAI